MTSRISHTSFDAIDAYAQSVLLFITAPDRKTVKNRVHLDLRPADRTREQEVERILALGASQLADHRRPDGSGWITLADPEGNEFCVLSRDRRVPEPPLDGDQGLPDPARRKRVQRGPAVHHGRFRAADPARRQQAELVARAIAEVPALIVTSPYRRARETAEPTIGRFPAAACRVWPVQEFTYLGDLYGRSSTASEREPHVRAYWDQADPGRRHSDHSESFTDLLTRSSDCLAG